MAQVSPEIKTLFQQAQRAQSSGQLDVAQALFAKILRLNERLPEVHFHLGRLEMQRRAPKKALKHLRRAQELKPTEPMVWRLLLDALIAAGDSRGVDKLLKSAETAPLTPQVFRELEMKARTGNRSGEANLGSADPAAFQEAVRLFQSGQAAEAAEAAEALHRRHPGVAPILAVLGASRAALAQLDEAETAYREAIRLDDSYAEAHLQLGQLLQSRRRFDEATPLLERARELMADSPLVAKFLGMNYTDRDHANSALPLLEKAHAELPDDPEAAFALSRCLFALRRFEDARATFASWAERPSAPPPHLALMGNILNELEQTDSARAFYERALAARPNFGPGLSGLAWIAHHSGDFDLSAKYFAQACESGTIDGRLARNYSAGRKLLEDDPILPQIRAAYEEGTEVPGTRADLAFALAKAAEDQGRPAEAFELLRIGNDTLAERFPPRDRLVQGLNERARLTWRPETAPVEATDAPRLIFISGMPRSGTTLVEQIVSSHSTVTPGGEIGLLNGALSDRQRLAVVEERGLAASELRATAAEIAQRARTLAPEASVLTDKAVLANADLGFAPQLCPGSRFIVVRRDPRDNCLSIYKNRFADGTHRYTTDLKELAHNYLAFLKGMEFWREAAPEAFLEVRYEDIIGDPETGARALIDYCGLEWEEACLRFYENARTVRTLSAYQVRQPIYSSSVGAWRKFEAELKPLIDILRDGGALEEWD